MAKTLFMGHKVAGLLTGLLTGLLLGLSATDKGINDANIYVYRGKAIILSGHLNKKCP